MQDSSAITTNTALGRYAPLTEISKWIPRMNGHRVHVSTLWRWCKKGCNGIYLEYVRVGRTIMTSEFLLHKFFTELAKADSAQIQQPHFKHPKPKRRQTSEHRQKSIDEATAILRRAKIIA